MSAQAGPVHPDDDLPRRLAECRAPYLIGVRHHSAALARVMPGLLADFRPEAVLVEMPPDFGPWLEHLGRGDLEAPVALAACDEDRLISFYPLADFSPELAAIRWAARHDVPVIPCDLGLAATSRLERRRGEEDREPNGTTALDSLLHRHAARDSGELWEKLVETPACRSSPEAIRRAALTFGWMVRHSSNGPTPADRHREAAMRAAVAAAPPRSVAVVGSFHAAALLPEPVLWSLPDPVATAGLTPTTLATSLIPYSFAQLDQRSGYPAGIMDPAWQQAMLGAADPEAAGQLAADLAVELCRRLRQDGHVAGTPDATEIVPHGLRPGPAARPRRAGPGRIARGHRDVPGAGRPARQGPGRRRRGARRARRDAARAAAEGVAAKRPGPPGRGRRLAAQAAGTRFQR